MAKPAAPIEQTLDLKGLKCPLPVLKARRALQAMAPGDVLVVTATDPMAAIDIPHMAVETRNRLLAQGAQNGVLTFRIEKQ
jgi:tRNA 2-thiouridine synthesizing protein A